VFKLLFLTCILTPAPKSGQCILNTKKLFFAKLKVQGLGHPLMPSRMACVLWNPHDKGQTGPTPLTITKICLSPNTRFTMA